MDTSAASAIANRLNLTKTNDLGTYLGVKSAHGPVTGNHFTSILDRIKGRLEGWKAKTLSIAGRVTLAKSVLSSIPMYAMQTVVFPMGVCNEMDKYMRRFIWGGPMAEGTPNKLSLVTWDKVTRPKVSGG